MGAKASPERRCAILRELGLQIRTHRSGGLRCGGSGGRSSTRGGGGGDVGGLDFSGERGESVERGDSASAGDDVVVNPRDKRENTQIGCRRGGRPLSLLCGRADRLVPWPALAWWAATLPGSVARGGVTLWVRLVAFAVRVVMSRAASAVAVDVDSFRAAAPPGHRAGVVGVGGVDVAGVGEQPGRQRRGRGRGPGAVRALRRGEDHKEDGAAARVRDDDGGEGKATRARVHEEEGCGVVGKGSAAVGEESAAVVGTTGERSRRNRECQGAARAKGEGGGGRGGRGGGAAAEKVVVVLLPTHRSYLDFVLVSLFCASMRSFPGLSWLRVPKVAAADGPFGKEGTPLRWLMEKLGG